MALAKRPPPDLFKLATNAWTQPFWDAAAQHRLVVAQCGTCGTCRMPPTPFCPACQSQQIDWKTLSGLGEIYSYTIVDRAILPGMADPRPQGPAVIPRDGGGGVRLISNVVDVELADLAIGMPVQVVWDDLREGVAVPRFRPRTR
jgi:uncharacterized OB-fold protein